MFKSSIVAGLALMIVAGSAGAQGIGVGVAAGAAAPVGDFSHSHEVGWSVAGSVNAALFNTSAGIRLEGFYNDFSGKEATDARIAGGAANLFYEFGASGNRPYVIGGVGAYNSKFGGGGSSTNLGVNGGAGINFKGFTFVEARWHSFPRAGIRWQYTPVTIGVRF